MDPKYKLLRAGDIIREYDEYEDEDGWKPVSVDMLGEEVKDPKNIQNLIIRRLRNQEDEDLVVITRKEYNSLLADRKLLYIYRYVSGYI